MPMSHAELERALRGDLLAPVRGFPQQLQDDRARGLQAAHQLEPRYRLAKLNTEEVQEIAARLGIRSIPTLILFRNGREIARQSGAMDTGNLVRWITAQT